MKGYFGHNVTCIYLDQFAASNILDEAGSVIWEEISEVLLDKAGKGMVICPVPSEHFLESAKKNKEKALLLDQKFHEIGRGLAFLPEPFATANCIMSIVRNSPVSAKTFSDQLRFKGTLSEEGAFNRFQNDHRLMSALISEATTSTNELRDALSKKRFPKAVKEPVFQASKLLQINHFRERLDELIEKGRIISRGVAFSTGEIIDWPDLLLQILLGQHRMTSSEGIYLRKVIDQTGFDRIAPLDIRVTLTAHIAAEHKKETVNDQVDIMRLATALPAADLLFTDKQRKHELQETGLAVKYNTEVFSGTEADLKAFLSRISVMS